MSPAPLSPLVKVEHPVRTNSQDSADGIRKRVCKACDRCRLKKSKCDGTSPCSRCRADNAICVFGERKKSHDKVYPKGYVEMLEQQQGQLVAALQETYRQLHAAHAWPGPALSEASGHPLTHDILSALDLLESRADGSGEAEEFEEDCQKLQSRLVADGASYVHRRGSFSSESDHSQHNQTRSATTKQSRPTFRNSFQFDSAASSPAPQSPAPRQQKAHAATTQPSPLQRSPLAHGPRFYEADWSMPEQSEALMQTKFAMQTPNVQQSLSQLEDMMTDGQFDSSLTGYDANFGALPLSSYSQQFSNPYVGAMPDFNVLDPMELDFNRYLVAT
ncbi:Fluconazole resistance protein 1 [Elasticomyces elasticus]|uniref:Fluconazole resistance protein 1 n=1 Tax=Elasticomyces elasticus TaxID=574655 RepID=A0AAN7ZU10_9PEZI|nr:Fluconazole resistance protein 1 [Elasticomyces elasticus]